MDGAIAARQTGTGDHRHARAHNETGGQRIEAAAEQKVREFLLLSLPRRGKAAGVKLQTGGNHLDYRPLPILRDDIHVGDGPQRAKGLLLVVGCLEFPQLRAAQAGLHGAQRGADVPQCFNGQKPLK